MTDATGARPEARILIIDDEEDSFYLLRRLLRRIGATEELEWCSDGTGGLRRLRELADRDALPLLVLLDLRMPAVNGHEVLAALKADARFARLFVVVVSSSTLPEDIARAIQLGAFCYFEKFPLPEKLARVYEVAKDRAPVTPAADDGELALRHIIQLVEDALAVFYARTAEQTEADRELVNMLGTVRRRATERFLDRLNPRDGQRWPFPFRSSPT